MDTPIDPAKVKRTSSNYRHADFPSSYVQLNSYSFYFILPHLNPRNCHQVSFSLQLPQLVQSAVLSQQTRALLESYGMAEIRISKGSGYWLLITTYNSYNNHCKVWINWSYKKSLFCRLLISRQKSTGRLFEVLCNTQGF